MKVIAGFRDGCAWNHTLSQNVLDFILKSQLIFHSILFILLIKHL